VNTVDRDYRAQAGDATQHRLVRVVEIWLPSPDGPLLELGAASYGSLTEFETVSKQMKFPFDVGLPGKAWASRRPLILPEFGNSYFKRSIVALAAGLACGVALPVFRKEQLLAVVVLFLGARGAETGAIEVWSADGDGESTLALENGYYGAAELSKWTPDHIVMRSGLGARDLVWPARYPRGESLPGRVWETGQPWPTDAPASVYPAVRHHGPGLDIEAALGIPWPGDPCVLVSSRCCRRGPRRLPGAWSCGSPTISRGRSC
jgi:hypothetical protein